MEEFDWQLAAAAEVCPCVEVLLESALLVVLIVIIDSTDGLPS